MTYMLVVVRAFGPHAVGAVIDDEAEQRAVLMGEHANHVVRIAHALQED